MHEQGRRCLKHWWIDVLPLTSKLSLQGKEGLGRAYNPTLESTCLHSIYTKKYQFNYGLGNDAEVGNINMMFSWETIHGPVWRMILNPRRPAKICTWNVWTMFQSGQRENICREMLSHDWYFGYYLVKMDKECLNITKAWRYFTQAIWMNER